MQSANFYGEHFSSVWAFLAVNHGQIFKCCSWMCHCKYIMHDLQWLHLIIKWKKGTESSLCTSCKYPRNNLTVKYLDYSFEKRLDISWIIAGYLIEKMLTYEILDGLFLKPWADCGLKKFIHRQVLLFTDHLRWYC